MSFLRRLESPIGMLKRLFGMLVSGLVIFFPVVYGGATVHVGSEFVEFGSSLVRVIWHTIPSLGVHLKVLPLFQLSNCGHLFRELRPSRALALASAEELILLRAPTRLHSRKRVQRILNSCEDLRGQRNAKREHRENLTIAQRSET